MSLFRKTIFIIIAMLGFAILLFFLNTRFILMNSFSSLEQKYVQLDVSRVLSAVDDELKTMSRINADWASWDDSYQFITDRNERFINTNTGEWTFTALRIDVMLFLDNSGQIVMGEAFDFDTGEQQSIPAGLMSHITPSSLIFSNINRKEPIMGILQLPDGTMLISVCPILNSQGQGPVRGALLMGRYLDKQEIEELGNKTHLSVNLLTFNPSEDKMNPQSVYADLLNGQPVVSREIDNDKINAYAMIKDIYGKPALLLRVDLIREVFQQGQKASRNLGSLFLFVGTLFGLIMLWSIRNSIFTRIDELSQSVARIGINKDLSERLSVEGNDELATLAKDINLTLSQLEQAQIKLQESREQYRQLFDDSFSANYISTFEGRLLMCNRAFLDLFGFNTLEEVNEYPLGKIFPTEESRKEFISLLIESKYLRLYEHMLRKPDGTEIFVLENVMGLFNSEGRLIELQGQLIDITERKRSEEEIKYLSFHDKLTGLYNRAFFEEELQRLDTVRNLPITVVMGDVNGLKLVNDALGHRQGDRLLTDMVQIIRQFCRREDIVARWGGDEFLMLLPKTPEKVALGICDNIQQASICRVETLQASMSLGVASKVEASQDMQEIINLAEERMYRNKLLYHHSDQNGLIVSILKTMHERDLLSEEEVEKLRYLALDFGKIAGLNMNELNELELLADLHDIGNLSIPDDIFTKPDIPTADEWKVIRKHCELGYNIARSLPEIASIADAILAHHERWDGSGYPLGLKGDQIPLASRMIAIVDTYTAMMQGRPYREKYSSEEALAELKKYAGTQYDPHLVDLFVKMMTEDKK